MAAGKEPTIIIKKIKKVQGGHHGGAWKVAYADFVTAMMAFFLLLWLLASTSEAQKEGIADYFTPTTVIGSGTGTGSGGGTTSTPDGTDKSDKTPLALITGGAPAGPGKQRTESLIEADAEQAEFDNTEEQLKQAMEDPEMKDLAQNVLIKITPEGLQIDVLDSDKHPMFNAGTANLSPFGQTILAKISKIIERLPNYIAISGHTDAEPLNARGGSYTNWELSAERANTARRFISTKGIHEERIQRVLGRAATELLFPEDKLSPMNRRVTLLLLRGNHWSGSKYWENTPKSLISTDKVSDGLLRKK